MVFVKSFLLLTIASACLATSLFDEITGNVEIRSNGLARSTENSLEEHVEGFIKSHDFGLEVPFLGKVNLEARNLDNDEMNLKVNFNGVQEARKSKLKKIFIPIMVFLLLKAMTLVPLFLGFLGLKAWNGLQLSFISFVVSVGLAIFQLCQKLAGDQAHAHISAHAPWEAAAIRSFDSPAQNLAYSAYAQN